MHVLRRSPATDFLLRGGQSQSWLVNNKIITVTTSGGAKVTKAGTFDLVGGLGGSAPVGCLSAISVVSYTSYTK